MACPHVDSLDLRPPRPSDAVYREDCTQCFDSIDDKDGLDVCLSCFNGGCAGARNHSSLHFLQTNHPLVVHIKRTRKHVRRDEPPQKVFKLAIAAETEEDHYDVTTEVRCHECDLRGIDASSGQLFEVVDGIMKALTYSRKEEVKSWEQEILPCMHTSNLKQEEARKIASQDLGQCSMCELRENLWLCLVCGNLGCGRAQFGGFGGHSHAISHKDETGHSVCVKLGSITADGAADVYCYACDEERIDQNLAAHLGHWGINIAERQKTEKSLTEMQIEQNMRWEFSITTDDGKEMEPIFGPGFTGLKNLGNSCYLASVVQCLFSLPSFQKRYYKPNALPPVSDKPAEDLETQLRKLADGILSGRYSHPDTDICASDEIPKTLLQKGLSPSMFKHLIGRGHEEFSTMRQQDAFEFLLHLLKLITRSKHQGKAKDPSKTFKFVMEERLQCLTCMKVRYRRTEQDNISVAVPVRRKRVADAKNGDEGEKEEFESVTLEECLDIFTAAEEVELTCPSCGTGNRFTKRALFHSFPQTLIVNARRLELINWVPVKLDVPVIVKDEPFTMDKYLSKGHQLAEVMLPDDKTAPDTATTRKIMFVPDEKALEQLLSMGFPENSCLRALKNTGNIDAELATNWLFEHLDDPHLNDPLTPDEQDMPFEVDERLVTQLIEMGIPAAKARKALMNTDNNVGRAIDWVFSHQDDTGEDAAKSSGYHDDYEEEYLSAGSTQVPARFELQSIVCHKGTSIHSGHYVAFIRKQVEGDKAKSWVLFNDEKVVKAPNIKDMKKFAYVYFFQHL